MNWIWLFVLGLITYFIVQRVTGITRTPVWALWLVAMMPAFSLTAWAIAFGVERRMPIGLAILLFVGCLTLYLYLIQKGRIAPTSAIDTASPSASTSKTLSEQPAEISVSRPINKAEETSLQSCFPWSVYYLQNVEYRPQAVICRGQLRTAPEVAYKTIQENVAGKFGDRFFVVFQEGLNEKPFFALVPNPQASIEARQNQRLTRPGVALGLAAMTLLTTTLAGLEIAEKQLTLQPSILVQGLPYALAIMGVFAVRSLGSYWTARRYHVAATLPYFIPVIPLQLLPLGTVGSFIQIRSPIPHRKALFDLGVIGALAGVAIAIPLLFWGLDHSSVVALPSKPGVGLLSFEALNPKYSLVLAVLAKLALGSQLVAQKAIDLHPIAVAGWVGLLFSAFNLMPVGQLDGGRMVHAMFGQRTGAAIGQISRLLLLVLAFAQQHLLLWAILLLLLPATDEPALNDVTELNNARDVIGLLTLALVLLIILPAPKVVLAWLSL